MKRVSAEQLRTWPPYPLVSDGLTPMQRARERMEQTGQWAPWQVVGRRMAIGCVALEITQRCNLDCTYCYLSESSEALRDIPLAEVFRRIDMIQAHYGPNTDVQVTGGEPTLREPDDLVAIVRYIKRMGMRSSLFTNGVNASRYLLERLCEAGLEDVAFHVDMTQQRKGYASEMALNRVRREYADRARGLPLSVFFNTTVYPGNLGEIAPLARFFVENSDVVRLCAFQIGADTGRGTGRERGAVDTDSVQQRIEAGIGARLQFGAASAGHSHCNRYAYSLVMNGKACDFFSSPAFVQEMLARTSHIQFDRANRRRTVGKIAGFLLARPGLLAGFLSRAAKVAWIMRHDLIAARGRIGKLSFHIHNFMDAHQLDANRVGACSFMVMTPQGPLSMCVHNAKRDDYLLVPARMARGRQIFFWDPVSGNLRSDKPQGLAVRITRKNARGRARVALKAAAPYVAES